LTWSSGDSAVSGGRIFVPGHSTFSVNRRWRFRGSDILRKVFQSLARQCMAAGLVIATDLLDLL
jgi:hypothetical protein